MFKVFLRSGLAQNSGMGYIYPGAVGDVALGTLLIVWERRNQGRGSQMPSPNALPSRWVEAFRCWGGGSQGLDILWPYLG